MSFRLQKEMQLFKWRWIFFSFSELKRLQWQLKRRNRFPFISATNRLSAEDEHQTHEVSFVMQQTALECFLIQVLTENCYKYLGMLATQASRFCCSIIHRTSSKCEICARLRRVLCSTAILTNFYLRFDFELVIYECHWGSLVFKSSLF